MALQQALAFERCADNFSLEMASVTCYLYLCTGDAGLDQLFYLFNFHHYNSLVARKRISGHRSSVRLRLTRVGAR